jgi:vacuolar-type H+-ATPase subunit F/Vma7
MSLCVLIGDEVTAAGFRLAGVDVHVPEPASAPELFRRLAREARILLVTAEAAEWLSGEELRRAVAAEDPLVLVIPDVRGRVQPPDLTRDLRRQLGMAE